MIQKTVKIRKMKDSSSVSDDLAFWLSRPSEERLAAVDFLRRQYYGNTERLQRTARVIQCTQFVANKKALSRKKDEADLEVLGEN